LCVFFIDLFFLVGYARPAYPGRGRRASIEKIIPSAPPPLAVAVFVRRRADTVLKNRGRSLRNVMDPVNSL